MKKDILVTGGLGYIGSELSAALVQKGWRVTIVDLDIFNTASKMSLKKVCFHNEDIRHVQWENFCRENMVVIHLAAISNDPGYGVTAEEGYSINYEASVRLFESCKRYKVKRFIFPSSCSVYGRLDSISEVDEKFSLNPLTNYALLKAKFEQYILKNAGEMDCVILRPATVYGYSRRQRLDLLINRLIINHWYGEISEVPVLKNIRPALYLPDLVRVYLMMAESDEKLHGVYNVAGFNHSIRETCAIVGKALGRETKIIEQDKDTRSYFVSSLKLKNFFPQLHFCRLSEGIHSMISPLLRGEFNDYKINDYYYNARCQSKFFAARTL